MLLRWGTDLPLAQVRRPCSSELTGSPLALGRQDRSPVPGERLHAGRLAGRREALCGRFAARGSAASFSVTRAGLPVEARLGGSQGSGSGSWETHSLALSHLKISQEQLGSTILSVVCQEFAEPLSPGCGHKPVANPGVAAAGILVAHRSCPLLPSPEDLGKGLCLSPVGSLDWPSELQRTGPWVLGSASAPCHLEESLMLHRRARWGAGLRKK